MFDLYYVPYQKVMTFPQANSDIKQIFRPLLVLLDENVHIPGLLPFKIIFSAKIAPP
jgi:hypothetical protein